ncbi:hypothetical protein IEQ34_022296 [Dendrobium chrysotoxum]|uniref:Uncharacterized protein n=1 Tax=Dendrobium chrysotoxum TaxID=161865 RepID=A0AAV7FWV2_DENCH|nr:hypothetical protein IEQ34_022296 [Dendrobium chrysotoxum]
MARCYKIAIHDQLYNRSCQGSPIEISKRRKKMEGSAKGTDTGVEAGVEEEMIAKTGLDEMIQVSEMLKIGKKLFKDLNSEFEECRILIHREQMKKTGR